MNHLVALLIGMSLLITGMAQAGKVTVEANGKKDNFKRVSQDDFTFKWKIVDEELTCVINAPTKGWVAVGFNTEKPKMDQSNFIIGFVKEGKAFIEDHIAKGWSHQADKENNIINYGGEENDEQTTMTFTIPLSNDEKKQDVKLSVNQEIYLLFALGQKDNFKSYHKKRTVVKIKL